MEVSAARAGASASAIREPAATARQGTLCRLIIIGHRRWAAPVSGIANKQQIPCRAVPAAAGRAADPGPAEAEAAADGKQDPVPAEADDKQAPPVDTSPSASPDEAAAAGDAAEAKQAGKGGSRGKKR